MGHKLCGSPQRLGKINALTSCKPKEYKWPECRNGQRYVTQFTKFFWSLTLLLAEACKHLPKLRLYFWLYIRGKAIIQQLLVTPSMSISSMGQIVAGWVNSEATDCCLLCWTVVLQFFLHQRPRWDYWISEVQENLSLTNACLYFRSPRKCVQGAGKPARVGVRYEFVFYAKRRLCSSCDRCFLVCLALKCVLKYHCSEKFTCHRGKVETNSVAYLQGGELS